jgi:hypothetical protein
VTRGRSLAAVACGDRLQSAAAAGSVRPPRPPMMRPASLLALLALAACSTKAPVVLSGEAPAASAPPVMMGETPKPAVTMGETPRPPAQPAQPQPPEPVAAMPAASASAAPAPDAPAATGPADAPLPAVKVSNIGMHIGGGPNDDVTKDPIRRSVHPHFDAFRRCFAQVEDAGKGGDFGLDLRIDRAGGKAQISHPRTSLKGKEFKACVLRTFEAIDFLKPKGGTTTVSYSLRFTPGG